MAAGEAGGGVHLLLGFYKYAQMAFSATFASAKFFLQLVESLRTLTDEVNLMFEERRLRCQAMDASHVALCMYEVNEEALSAYSCARAVTVGVNLLTFKKALTGVSKSDELVLMNSSDDDNITLAFGPAESKTRVEIHRLNLDQSFLEPQPADQRVRLTLSPANYSTHVTRLKGWGDYVKISLHEDGLVFNTNGSAGTLDFQLRSGDSTEIRVSEEPADVDGAQQASLLCRLRLDLLQHVCKAKPIATGVRMFMEEGREVCVEADLADNMGSLRFYIAPMVDDVD
jgi:proliferating cell nuclear antigen PCNA